MERRTLFATAVLGLAVPAVAAPPHPDAELLALGRELERLWAVQDALPRGSSDEAYEAVMDPCSDVVDRIEQIPARTFEGLRVKALAISWCNSGEEIDPDRFGPFGGATTDARVAASIVRDLLAMSAS